MGILCVVLLSFIHILPTQRTKNAADNVDPRIANARSVFVSNVEDDIPMSAPGPTGAYGVDQPYYYLYSALQHWGQYRIVLDPADADLVLEIRFHDPVETIPASPKNPVPSPNDPFPNPDRPFTEYVDHPQLSLTIRDAKTGDVLKDFTEQMSDAIRSSNREKNFAHAAVTLLNDMAKAAGHPLSGFTLPEPVPVAPMPIKILAAKKLFIAKADDDRVHAKLGQNEQLYAQMTLAAKGWGQYELTTTAQDADILWIPSVYDSDVRLEIRDAKSQILLSGIYQLITWGTLDKHMDEAAVSLLNHAAQIAGKTLLAPNQGTWLPASDQIPITISAPAAAKAGAEVLAHVTVKNSGNFSINFNYAQGDPLTCVVEVLDSGGKPAAETTQGSKLKAEHAAWQGQPVSYTLDPGETQTRDCAVSDLFDMSKPGKYSIQVRQLDGRAVQSNVVAITVGR